VKSVELCKVLYNIVLCELFIEHDVSVIIKTKRIGAALQWVSKCDSASQGEFRITIHV